MGGATKQRRPDKKNNLKHIFLPKCTGTKKALRVLRRVKRYEREDLRNIIKKYGMCFFCFLAPPPSSFFYSVALKSSLTHILTAHLTRWSYKELLVLETQCPLQNLELPHMTGPKGVWNAKSDPLFVGCVPRTIKSKCTISAEWNFFVSFLSVSFHTGE